MGGVTRPWRICAAGFSIMGVLLCIGCTPGPAPAQPFGEFTVTQQGGVAGIYRPLLVQPDGVALLMSNDPASGSIAGEDLDRLGALLTSEQFRIEAAANSQKVPDQGCVDDISWSVTMGALTVSTGGRCSGNDSPTPATIEIIGLRADEVGGNFAADVPVGPPGLVRFTIERQATRYYPAATFSSTALGKITMRVADTPVQTRNLTVTQHNTLRLLLDRQTTIPAKTCDQDGPYRLRIGGSRGKTVTYCVGEATSLEWPATIALVENPFLR